MITPTTEIGRPAAITPRSTVGDSSFALPTNTDQRDKQQRETSPCGARRRRSRMLVLDDRAVGRHRQKVIPVSTGLKYNEESIQRQRGDGGECELRRRKDRPRAGRREIRHHHAECRQGGDGRERRTCALSVERDRRSSTRPYQDRQANDAVAREDHGREHRVSREGLGRPGASDHQRDDERDFDHGHRDGQNQRAVRFADTVSDDLGMVDGGKDRGSEECGDHANDEWRKSPAPRKRENDDAQNRHERGPGENR
jgi:hypothetical protein